MKKIIDKFWIFWSKFKACVRFLFESKTVNWVLCYEQVNAKTNEKTMTYQTEKTANAGNIYNLMYTGYKQTAKIVYEQLQEMQPEAFQYVKEHINKSDIITEFFMDTAKVANKHESPLKKMSKLNKT